MSQGKVQVYGEVIDCKPVKTETYLMETLCLSHLILINALYYCLRSRPVDPNVVCPSVSVHVEFKTEMTG